MIRASYTYILIGAIMEYRNNNGFSQKLKYIVDNGERDTRQYR